MKSAAPKKVNSQNNVKPAEKTPVAKKMQKKVVEELSEEDSGSEYSSNDYEEDEPSVEPEEGTPKFFERAMMKTIKEFCSFVGAITKDLEDNEQEEIREARDRNEDAEDGNGEYVEVPTPIWNDSTFKINLIKGLLSNMFKSDELIKYYIVYVLPMKPWLVARQEKFFLNNDHIYPNAPKEDIIFFKNLWAIDGTMTLQEKDTIWEFWDTLIEIAEDWQESTGWDPEKDSNFSYKKIDYKKAERNAK